MGKLTISMAIFNCYVSSPEGTSPPRFSKEAKDFKEFPAFGVLEASKLNCLPANGGPSLSLCFFAASVLQFLFIILGLKSWAYPVHSSDSFYQTHVITSNKKMTCRFPLNFPTFSGSNPRLADRKTIEDKTEDEQCPELSHTLWWTNIAMENHHL